MFNDIVLALPFGTGFLWATGGARDPILKKFTRYLRRILVGLLISYYTWINYSLELKWWLIITSSYWLAASLPYGKFIAKRQWHWVFLIGMTYGLASLSVMLAIKKFNGLDLFVNVMFTGWIFTLMTIWSNSKYPIGWKWVEGVTGFFVGIIVVFIYIN